MKLNLDHLKKKSSKTKSSSRDSQAKEMQASEGLILSLLALRHKDRQWLFFPEMIVSTEAKKDNEKADTRLDAWAFNIWPSRGYERITYEIKISRDDFTRELRQPGKNTPGLAVSNRFYYVAPANVISPGEVPKGCGLYTVRKPRGADYHVLKKLVVAPFREIEEPGLEFWASMARRVNIDEGLYDKVQYNKMVVDQYDRSQKRKKK